MNSDLFSVKCVKLNDIELYSHGYRILYVTFQKNA